MVSFYFSQVRISRFRGIKDLVLDLSPGAPTVLIGPNNAGKSTVLDAIGLCLGSPKFSKHIVDDRDFWTDDKGLAVDEFLIEVRLAARISGSLPSVKPAVGDPIYVHALLAVGNRGEPSTTRYLLDDKGENIMLSVSTPVSKARKEEFKGLGYGGRRFARPSDIGKWMPTIFQLDSQNLYTSLYEWRTGPLQRLMKKYREHLREDSWAIDETRQMPEYLDKLHAFINDTVLQTPFWRDTLSVELAAKLQAYLGRSPGFRMRPQLEDLEEWIRSELMFRVSPGARLAAVDSRRLGAGWQSLIRMAALEVVMKLEEIDILLLMEEPETFLHPHLRRRMRRVFDELQNNGSQCLVTTHSSELVSFALSQDIVRLRMTPDGCHQHRYSTSTATQAMKDEEKLHEHGNHEIVFASCVVLTEGKDDECAVKLGFEKLGLDCDSESISVVECGGVDNLPDYAKLCATLGITWVAIHDKDIQPDGNQKANTKKAREELAQLKGQTDLILDWENTLEDVLGCSKSKATPQWVLQAFGTATWSTMSKDPALQKFCTVIEAAKMAALA
jgi:putative ATP-dependent endonuclease of the OLD family